jgi:hypothetical protein
MSEPSTSRYNAVDVDFWPVEGDGYDVIDLEAEVRRGERDRDLSSSKWQRLLYTVLPTRRDAYHLRDGSTLSSKRQKYKKYTRKVIKYVSTTVGTSVFIIIYIFV